MDKLVNSYIMSSVEQFDLNCTAARVLLNAMPGLESAAVFQDMVSLARYSKSFNSQDLIYILSSSCYTFPCKLVMRIWCFTLFTLLFFFIFLHIYKILDQDDNFFLISLTILITFLLDNV